ncbi:hypothetical protein LH704_07745 [Burkholderia cenocepacia]|uniref:hypothetical protein n=1 Tax=Burkholderia cenocepacia TaxID=95486 RepID=UPI001F42EFF0|nr:hypothetical protein [Burkholderia cenocepacia]MCF1366557.1 hypothetical protein [Burkholderia cenocepacia]MCF1384090.1 hypothetical protein [Burkholderia cenocepacia]
MTFPVRSAIGMDDVADTNGSAWWPRPTRGGIIEITVKDFCKSLSNDSDNVRFSPLKPHSFLLIFNQGIFIRSPFLFFGTN